MISDSFILKALRRDAVRIFRCNFRILGNVQDAGACYSTNIHFKSNFNVIWVVHFTELKIIKKKGVYLK